MKRAGFGGVILVALIGVMAAQTGKPAQAPMFEVDPFWPRPLPNHWVLGSTIGLSVDSQDHVWILHRPQTVDDNFKEPDKVTKRYLKDALEAVASGQPVPLAETKALGCSIKFKRA